MKGYYKNNRPDGWGCYIHYKCSISEGIWEGNKLIGICFETWPDGSIYQGCYLDCRKHGIGTYKWPDGTIYEGE